MISVVIPTHNRPRQLQACLGALAESTYPPDRFEVVVVDDGGTPPVPGDIGPAATPLTVRVHRQQNAGPAAARNAGAALARGRLLVFTDDDCLPEPEWLETLAARAEALPGHLIGGATINALADNTFSAASQELVSYLYEYGRDRAGDPEWSAFFTSNNLAVPADGFKQIGGFDAEFPLAAGEDRDFCDRWSAHGLPMTFAPDARVMHAHRLDLRSFCRQHWNYGRGAFHFHSARGQRGADPVRPQPLTFYLNLLRFPFARTRWPRATLEAGLLALSQLVNAGGYYYERIRS